MPELFDFLSDARVKGKNFVAQPAHASMCCYIAIKNLLQLEGISYNIDKEYEHLQNWRKSIVRIMFHYYCFF